MNYSASNYISAYNKGLLSTSHPLFQKTSLLNSIIREAMDLHELIEQLYNVRDEEGFINVDFDRIHNLRSRLQCLESDIQGETEELDALITKLYPIQPATPITMV